VFSLKRSTAGNFTVTFRVLSQKNMTEDSVLELVPLRGLKSSRGPRNRVLVALGVLFKMSEEHSRPFYIEVFPGFGSP